MTLTTLLLALRNDISTEKDSISTELMHKFVMTLKLKSLWM